MIAAATHITWFSAKPGPLLNPAGLRILGNGITSPYGESLHSPTDRAKKGPVVPENTGARP